MKGYFLLLQNGCLHTFLHVWLLYFSIYILFELFCKSMWAVGILNFLISPVIWFSKLFWFWLNSFSCIFAYRCFHLFYSVMSTNTLTDAFRIPNLVVIFQFQYRCQLMDLILVISIFFLLLIFGFDLVHCCQFHILSMFHNFRKMQVQSLYRTI